MREIRSVAANLALDEAVASRIANGEQILHLGFGESRLPVYPGLAEALSQGASRNAYGPVTGWSSTRRAVAGYFERRSLPTAPDQVVMGPGSKSLVLATIASVPGDVLIAKPSWVTYGPQVELAGRVPIPVEIPEECGGVPDPSLLAAAIGNARANGLNPSMIILTSPDNPTGTVVPEPTFKDLAELAVEHDLVVISDEIYGDVTFPGAIATASPATLVPERTVTTTGLSKSLSLGGWRIGAARFPAGADGAKIRERVAAFASESWSNLAGPQQSVAEYAFSEPDDLVEYRSKCTRLHGIVAAAVYRVFIEHGASCRPPTGGFYVYPDLESHRPRLEAGGVGNSRSLQERLLESHQVAVLGGHAFGDDPKAFRFRAATSMMYGATPGEQLATLAAPDPLEAPAVRANLDHLDRAVTALVG